MINSHSLKTCLKQCNVISNDPCTINTEEIRSLKNIQINGKYRINVFSKPIICKCLRMYSLARRIIFNNCDFLPGSCLKSDGNSNGLSKEPGLDI